MRSPVIERIGRKSYRNQAFHYLSLIIRAIWGRPNIAIGGESFRHSGGLFQACKPPAAGPPQTGGRIKPGQKLGALYFDEQLPVVRHRLYQAGVRLAMVLNECFE
jgi:hypothetical protein